MKESRRRHIEVDRGIDLSKNVGRQLGYKHAIAFNWTVLEDMRRYISPSCVAIDSYLE